MERKKAVDKDRLERKRANLGSGSHAMDEDDDEGGSGSGVREFARRQGADAAVHDGDSVMVWAILEGQPGKVGNALEKGRCKGGGEGGGHARLRDHYRRVQEGCLLSFWFWLQQF